MVIHELNMDEYELADWHVYITSNSVHNNLIILFGKKKINFGNSGDASLEVLQMKLVQKLIFLFVTKQQLEVLDIVVY